MIWHKLDDSVATKNIYCLETLLYTLEKLNGEEHAEAEDCYEELSERANKVAEQMIYILNMEMRDDNEINRALDWCLEEAKKIGLRGEIVDVCFTLKMLRENIIKEMEQRTDLEDDKVSARVPHSTPPRRVRQETPTEKSSSATSK